MRRPCDLPARWMPSDSPASSQSRSWPTRQTYYLNNMEAKDHWLAKPFWNVADATDTMMVLGQLLAGLNLSPGMRVLDFGAGSGWMSRMLTQLGCEVVVCDVSPTALEPRS